MLYLNCKNSRLDKTTVSGFTYNMQTLLFISITYNAKSTSSYYYYSVVAVLIIAATVVVVVVAVVATIVIILLRP